MLRPDLHAKVQVSMSVPSARIVRRTDGQTDTRMMSKLLHPPLTQGVKRDQNAVVESRFVNFPSAEKGRTGTSMFI